MASGMRQWAAGLSAAVLLAAGAARAQAPALECGGLRLGFGEDGAFRVSEGGVLRSGGVVWGVAFEDGTSVTAAGWAREPWGGTVRTEAEGGRLVQHWESPGLVVRLEGSPAGAGEADLRVAVVRSARGIRRVDFPLALCFDTGVLERMVFPQPAGEGVGLALAGRFFGPHLEKPGGYAARVVGPQAYAELFGGPLRQLDDNEPPAALRVTAEGREWLDGPTAALVNAARLCVNRPSAPGQTPLVLVDSDSGPAVSASGLGGTGLLLRIAARTGGQDGGHEARLQQAIVASVTATLTRRFPERFRGRVAAVVSLAQHPHQGGWTGTPVGQWLGVLRGSRAFREAGTRVIVLSTPEEVRAALRDSQTALILNPYGEMLPTGAAARWREDVRAIGEFVRRGGFWWEVGGYPFFYVLEPQPYLSVSASYPGCTADFVHLEGAGSALALFGVQPLMRQPWDRTAAVTPAEWSARGTPGGGELGHSWEVDLPAGAAWVSPPLRATAGPDVRAALSAYAAAIGLRTPLSAKVREPVLGRLKGAVLVRLGGATAAEQTRALERLPAGSLVHFTEYLRGGFDKQYPDHLPPRASWGTGEDLARFYARGHELGHLMMPYTNTSWWCIDPKGPTFEREGEEPLSRRRDGSLIRERYASNEGYQVCFWHRAVQEAHRRTRRQFSEEYPSDVLFQDQVGARRWRWDYNPAAPSPAAWIDGLHSLSMEDAAHVPLATEDGHDRVAEFESMLCGMAWDIVPSRVREAQRLIHRLPAGEWGIYPIMQLLAHDKVLFTLHDLGHFVVTQEQLAYVLGLGYSLSYAVAPDDLERAPVREWLGWLDALQKKVCARYAGAALTGFRYAGGFGGPGFAASYAGLEVAANLGPEPMPPALFGPAGGWAGAMGLEVAGHGFLAAGEGLRAGFVRERDGGTAAAPFGFALEQEPGGRGGRGALWACSGQRIVLPWPGEGTPEVEARAPGGTPARAACVRRGAGLAVTLPEIGDETSGIPMPAALAGKPFAAWGRPRPTVAVVNLGEGAPSAWVRVSAAEWVRVLSEDPGLGAAGAAVVQATSAGALRALLEAPEGERPFAVINPYGEYFCAEGLDRAEAMLDAIGRYVRTGGIWWETGGYSFFSVCSRTAEGTWETRRLGDRGARRLGFACAGLPVETPPSALRVTSAGRDWFGEAAAARIEGAASGVQRGFEDDEGVLVLVDSAEGDFVAATRCGGWGWLFRLGGFNPDPETAGVAVCGTLRHLLTQPWPVPEPTAALRLWAVEMRGL